MCPVSLASFQTFAAFVSRLYRSSTASKLYHGSNPMEVADRLREEGELDYLQYRWIGAVLCRGIRRLNRPVVWSTYVRIDGGPRRVARYWYMK